eukprot:TRINITY_DN2760_c0_g1_i2.p1 TRINITY_DN2760_c0_g1~~TRINITY_DN2760_c0_g1_i2.p1  ORF type:complete len:304 (+),score=42.10 TRINITY_DN2760_c0_g1_i2:29-913(+)
MFNTRIALFLLVLCCPSILGYKPVIMMHGFSFDENHGTYHDYDNIIQWISEVHPGQKTVSLDIFNGEESMTALWKQLPKIIELVRNVTSSSEFDDGYHIIGHSQGGLLTRCVAESMPEHKIENLISMAGVHYGQYGLAAVNKWFPNFTIEALTQLLYTTALQDTFSAANFWHYPINTAEYLKYNIFLPLYNNEVLSTNSSFFKENLLKVKQYIMLGSPADTTLDPWQTSLFGFYDSNLSVIPMEKQDIFINDTFGLRTLYSQGRLIQKTVPGIEHAQWLSNKENFVTTIMPFLT